MTRAESVPIPLLGEETACSGCGYNLVTLGAGAVCPECGLPVALSLQSDNLRYANPVWLARIRLSLLLGVVSGLLLIPYEVLQRLTGVPGTPMYGILQFPDMHRWVAVYFWFAWLLNEFSSLLITSREPRERLAPWRWDLRSTIRLCVLLDCLWAAHALRFDLNPSATATPTAYFLSCLFMRTTGMVSSSSFYLLLHRWALRAARPVLTTIAVVLLAFWLILETLFILHDLLYTAVYMTTPGTQPIAALTLSCGSFFWMILTLMSGGYMAVYFWMLGRIIANGRERWGAERAMVG